jgi:hypothetical protein
MVFESHSKKANHIRWQHRDNTQIGKTISEAKTKLKGELLFEERSCQKCATIFVVSYYSGLKRKPVNTHCSRKCANSRIQTTKMNESRSKSAKALWKTGHYDLVQESKLKRNKTFSSKTERAILEHFKTTYPDSGWTSGGSLKVEDSRISRDMYSDKLKVCFEYDGIWHFKDIHNQLDHKKLVDSRLEQWCILNKYRLVRIDEDAYTGFSQVEELLYNRSEDILKVGNRY